MITWQSVHVPYDWTQKTSSEGRICCCHSTHCHNWRPSTRMTAGGVKEGDTSTLLPLCRTQRLLLLSVKLKHTQTGRSGSSCSKRLCDRYNWCTWAGGIKSVSQFLLLSFPWVKLNFKRVPQGDLTQTLGMSDNRLKDREISPCWAGSPKKVPPGKKNGPIDPVWAKYQWITALRPRLAPFI